MSISKKAIPVKGTFGAAFKRYNAKTFDLIPLHMWDDKRRGKNGKIQELGKAPVHLDWTKRPYNSVKVRDAAIEAGRNIGIRLRANQVVIDVDPRNGGEEGFSTLCHDLELDPDEFPRVITGSGGWHCYLSKPADVLVRDTLEGYPGVEFKTKGRQVVAAGSKHPNGKLYKWSKDHPRIEGGAPLIPTTLLDRIKRPARSASTGGGQYDQVQIAELLSKLEVEDFGEQNKWFQLMQACHHASNGDARQEFIAWSTDDPAYAGDADKIGRRWDSLDPNRDDGVTFKTLNMHVAKAGHADALPAQSVTTDDFHDDIDPDAMDFDDDDEDALTMFGVGDDDTAAKLKKLAAEGKGKFDEYGQEREFWTPTDDMPYKVAEEYVVRNHPTLVRYRGDWLEWNGSHYATIEDETVKAEIYKFTAKGYEPNKTTVSHVEDSLRAVAHVAGESYDLPCWLDGTTEEARKFDAKEILAFKDCLLHLPTMTKLAATPNFFTRNALSYGFDANAAKPKLWRKFMLQVFKASPKSIGILQEIFGYMLLPDNRYQKGFLWNSPPRGGKGTTLNILQDLIGEHNCCAPSMDGLGKDPILATMIGKQLAIVSDMQIGKNTNLTSVVGNMLRISGGDPVTFDRKFKDAWTGKLMVRFFILTNLPPHFPDISGAITNRFIILQSFASWLGVEDESLYGKLKEELPGILLWAIAGWKRLRARKRFVQSPEGARTLRTMAETSSPVKAFIRECCIFDRDAITPKQGLFIAWDRWENKLPDDGDPTTSADDGTFAKALLACSGGKVRETRPRAEDGERVQSWSGIRLRDWMNDGEYRDTL